MVPRACEVQPDGSAEEYKGSTQLTEADRLDVRDRGCACCGCVRRECLQGEARFSTPLSLSLVKPCLPVKFRSTEPPFGPSSAPSTQERRLSDYRNENGIRRSHNPTSAEASGPLSHTLREGLRNVQRWTAGSSHRPASLFRLPIPQSRDRGDRTKSWTLTR